MFCILLEVFTQHCFGWKPPRHFLTETSQTDQDSSETEVRFLAKQPLMVYIKVNQWGLSMSKTIQDKLPQYVYRTPFGVYRLRRNVPKDIVEVSGRKLWYKVLGNDFKDAMRTYSTALLEFDRFVATYRNEAPVRDAVLAIVASEYGEESMLQLARGDVDENFDFALQDLASKVEEDVKPEVVSAIYSGVLPEAPLSIAECIDRHFTYGKGLAVSTRSTQVPEVPDSVFA